MKFRAFGRTGWQVSEIGFGAWQLGGDWGKVDDAASIDTLLYAFDKGINFVDTAELYGNWPQRNGDWPGAETVERPQDLCGYESPPCGLAFAG